MSRIIEVIVSTKGETTVQTKGYEGSDCLRASRFLEEARRHDHRLQVRRVLRSSAG